eukprot:GHVN01007319.1.p1 GENE.GHVN01007319.1~~GHVN01007319.1.p1  ORF type:complete len:138 (-),score=11.81 GHVN01007319.1:281-694(-)
MKYKELQLHNSCKTKYKNPRKKIKMLRINKTAEETKGKVVVVKSFKLEGAQNIPIQSNVYGIMFLNVETATKNIWLCKNVVYENMENIVMQSKTACELVEGTVIGYVVPQKLHKPQFDVVDELDTTARGTGGWGSTG